MKDYQNRTILYRKASVVCFVAFWTILIATASLTHVQGEFSYTRFGVGLACWLLALAGAICAFLSKQKAGHKASRLLSVALITFNVISIILGTIFLAGGLYVFRLERKAKQEEAKGRTNANVLAFTEFRSNRSFYMGRYSNATRGLAHFNDIPISSLRSKELLQKRGTNFDEFMAAGLQLREFFINGLEKFRQEVEGSDQAPQVISNALRNFARRDLYLWDETYTVLEKTLQMTSNTLILNNLLLSNFDNWHVSNARIVFGDANFQTDYFEIAAKVKQFKSELDNASRHLDELQSKQPASKGPQSD